MSNIATPQEKFWDHQKDGLTRIRKDLFKKVSLNKANSRANSINGTASRASSLTRAEREKLEKEAQKVVRRGSLPNRPPSDRSSSQVSYCGVPSRTPSTIKDGVPHKVLIGRPDAFKGKETPPVPEPKVSTPPGRRANQGSPGPRNGTPPSQLPRMKSKPKHEKERLPRRYTVVPPVPPRRAFYQPGAESHEDSWGESESDDSYDEEDGYMGSYPYPVFVQPQPMFAPQPMYYHHPRRHKRKKKVVIRQPPKPYTMDQATYTINHQETQWDDPDAGQLMDVGVDPMNPYIERIDRAVGTFDVRRGDSNMSNKTTASERERRRRDRQRWEEERLAYDDLERRRRIELDRRNQELAEREQGDRKGSRREKGQDRSYQERKGALDRDRAYREKMAREQDKNRQIERNRRKHAENVDYVNGESVSDSSEGPSDLYNKLKARQSAIDYVVDDPIPPAIAQRLREESTSESRDTLRQSEVSFSPNSQNSRGPVGSVKSFSGSIHSLPATYKNDPQDPPPRSINQYRPASYEEISIPVPNVYASDDLGNSTQTLGPSRIPKFYYQYTQSRPRYLQDRNALFDERTNSVLKRYKYGTGLYDQYSPESNLPQELKMIKHFLDYPDSANTFAEALIADFLDEDIIPDVLIDTIAHMNTLPATHPMFHPSKQVANDLIDTEVIWMAKGIVGEVAREFVDGYLEEEFNKKKDPLEEFLDDLFYEVVFDGSTEAAREAVLEMADMYVMNSSIFDYLTYITDEIIREEAASVLDEALEEMMLEDFVNDEIVEDLIDEEAFIVAHEVLTEYDTKLRRKTVKDIDRLGQGKLLESLILNDILRRIAHQAKIWTESEYMDKAFNSIVADVLLREYLDVLGSRKKTVENRPVRKVHEKMVTDVALDVLLDELCQGLDEDLGELDTHEVGGLPDEAAPANIHSWLYGAVEPLMQPTPDISIPHMDDFAPAEYNESPINTGNADDLI